jgi:hypothetical protein
MKRLAMVFFIFLTAPSAFTQPQEPQLQVATRLIKPFGSVLKVEMTL